ncbi:MAG TPA: hypothetical protein VGS12_02215 [Caulobacteraceae bacterium]|nr:hypothetical protein [Caulobacteraceae bacterium]
MLRRGVVVHGTGELTVPCAILDSSSGGARAQLASLAPVGLPTFLIDLTDGVAFRARRAWTKGGTLGLQFQERFDLLQPAAAGPPVLRRLWLESIRLDGADD